MTAARSPVLRGQLRLGESMARHSSWRAGGLAERFYQPADLDDLGDFLASLPPREPLWWLGLGSNLLVRDGGLEGTVICTRGGGALQRLDREGRAVIVGAGMATAQLARFCAREGLAGTEFLVGIPGTLGGALAMNAGALGHETWELVEAVETIDRRGIRRWRSVDAFTPSYRSVRRPAGEWFTAARLRLGQGEPEVLQERIRDCLRRRADTQPAGQASCGSVFRNPNGDFAGRLIEATGLKGRRVGQAVVSERHANFIVNEGGASAADIEALIELIRIEVRERHGIELVPEVQIIGRPAEEERR